MQPEHREEKDDAYKTVDTHYVPEHCNKYINRSALRMIHWSVHTALCAFRGISGKPRPTIVQDEEDFVTVILPIIDP